MIRTLFALLLTLAAATAALAWETPAAGSADRTALMEARHPQAEAALGAPVECVVEQANLHRNLAFAVVSPQRPGGGKTDLDATPLTLQEDGSFPHVYDAGRIDAFLQKSRQTWVARKIVIGIVADGWSDPSYCAAYAPVLPETCG